MTAEATITISNWAIIISTFLGPIFAILATRWLDIRKEKRDRKFQIFSTLMATRAYGLSAGHVEALNRIDVEFSDIKDKKVVDAWKAYLDHLSNDYLMKSDIFLWNETIKNSFVELLHMMSENLGYDFDKTHIKKMSYSPVAHGTTENEQTELRKLLINVLKGSVPITITNFPNAQNNEAQPELIKKSL